LPYIFYAFPNFQYRCSAGERRGISRAGLVSGFPSLASIDIAIALVILMIARVYLNSSTPYCATSFVYNVMSSLACPGSLAFLAGRYRYVSLVIHAGRTVGLESPGKTLEDTIQPSDIPGHANEDITLYTYYQAYIPIPSGEEGQAMPPFLEETPS
jgi:hypothetical protein